MKALALSGGGTKFIRHIAFADAAKQSGIKFDVIAGVSAGAIAAIPVAMDMLDEVRKIGLHLELKTFFDRKPLTEEGKLTLGAAWRLLWGRSSAGSMGNLRKLLKKIISKEVFAEYQSGNYPDCYTIAVSLHTGSRGVWNLKSLTQDLAVEAIMASASIPFFTPPVWIAGQPYADGGIRDHSPGAYLLQQVKEITSLTSVYTRPADYEILTPAKYQHKAVPVLESAIEVMNTEISKNDELQEVATCNLKGIALHQFFAPAIMRSVYDVNHGRLRKLYDRSFEADATIFKGQIV